MKAVLNCVCSGNMGGVKKLKMAKWGNLKHLDMRDRVKEPPPR